MAEDAMTEGRIGGTGEHPTGADEQQNEEENKMANTIKCEICGDVITGKVITLGDGAKVCADCLEESAEIVECEDCGEKFLAKNALIFDLTTYCHKCFIHWMLDDRDSDFQRFDEWREWVMEDDEKPTIERYEEFANGFIKEFGEYWTKKVRAIIMKEIDGEIAKAKNILRAA